MRYMLSLVGPAGGWEDTTPEQMRDEMARWERFDNELMEAGVFVAGEGLQDPATATTLRRADAEDWVITDGPFAEAKEQLGGFYVLQCRDLDEALAWAKRVPLRDGAIEVRPVIDYSESDQEAPAEAEGAAPKA
jgi:hypothetical protein